ncbi:MAG: hypothetical protein IKS41_00515 [Alphaproteobacteria bacterium]|nr:hypothetical protein [Alphaproteobacteria bacterium]
MANCCLNTLTIRGDEEIIKKCLDQIKNEDEGEVIDLNNIDPMPKELSEVIASPHLLKDVEILKKELSGEELSAEEKEQLNSARFDGKNNRENAKKALHCKEQYGRYSWYDWHLLHWGVKSNAYDSTLEWIKYHKRKKCRICFITPWEPPVKAMIKLSKQYPTLTFKFKAEEPGNEIDFSDDWRNGQGKTPAPTKKQEEAFEVLLDFFLGKDTND